MLGLHMSYASGCFPGFAGVVPACYLLDCVSVFALSVEDGAEVARLMENSDIAGGRP